jgi:hypothetical protein
VWSLLLVHVLLLLLQWPLSWQMTCAELQDLLLVAVNLNQEQLALQLLAHDSGHNKLLHADAAAPSSSSSTAAQLVEQLITTAVVRGHTKLAPELAATPAAQQLSTQQVTQLLYMCIQLEQPQGTPAYAVPRWDATDSAARRFGALSCFKALSAQQSAQSISASTVGDMMQLAAQQQRLWLGKQLCELPAAQQISLGELCELIVSVLQHKDAPATELLVQQLVNLPAAQQLPQEAAKQLLRRLIETCPVWPAWSALQCLTALQLGSQLTGGSVLQLLQYAASKGATGLLRFVAGLKPAANEIDDAEGFAAVLQATHENCRSYNSIADTLGQLPVLQLMQPDAVLSVIRSGIISKREYRDGRGKPQCVLRFVLQHPAVGKLSTAALEQLLLDAAQHKRLEHVADLLQVPAALQLSVEAVTALLQQAVQCTLDEDRGSSSSSHSTCCGLLLALPAVQQLPADVVSRLAAAVDAGNVAAVSRLCAVTAAADISC